MDFVSAYSKKRKVSVKFSGLGLTKQSFKDDCDINVIVARYARGQVPRVNPLPPRFEDVSSVDYSEAMYVVANARSAFEGLPARLRARFHNEPRELLAFVSDDRNRAEAEELGLVVKVAAAPVVAPAASAAAPGRKGSTEPLPPAVGGSTPPLVGGS